MRILIVDDSPYDRELIRRTLQRSFPDTTYVEVLHEQGFTDALRDGDYTLVCTDYFLKWTTGLEILRAVRAHSADLPVIMVTDTGSEEIAAEAMKAGLNDYVLKSHLARLPIAVRECLERLRIRREHVALEAQLQQVQKLESLGLLVSGIAHDFNNLLAAVMGYAQRGITHIPPAPAPFDEYFQHIHARAEQGARMTQQLLAFARGTPLEPRHVVVNEHVASLVDLIKTLLGASIPLSFHADPAVEAIDADPTQLEQVLVNLCMNARDAMPTGGRVEISTRKVEVRERQQHGPPYLPHGDYVLIEVRDTGIGMDEQTQARLFEPFFTSKNPGEGTGLGLAVVYGIVKQHHGVIRVKSQPGQGTTLSLYFPSVSVEGAPPAEQARDVLEAGTIPHTGNKRQTILLVEDDTDIQTILADVLQDCGYSVLVAGDGDAGIRLFEQHSPSIALVVADIMMPKMQGKDFQEFILKQPTGVKLLVMSGYQEAELQRRGLLDLRSTFLQKPFDLDEFMASIRQLLAS